MRKIVLVGALSVLAGVLTLAQQPMEFVGTVDRAVDPGRMALSVSLTPASDEAKTKVARFTKPGDSVFMSSMVLGDPAPVVYFVTDSSDTWKAIADVNRDGVLEASEVFPFEKTDAYPQGQSVLLNFETPKTAAVPVVPIRLGVPPRFAKANVASGGAGAGSAASAGTAAGPSGAAGAPPPIQKYLSSSYQPSVVGVVNIDGKPVKIRAALGSKTLAIDPAKGYQYVDVNSDGVFDEDMTSWEMGYGRGTPPVFHIGDGTTYVSMKSVDVAAGKITLVPRAASDYERIELRVGSTLPDYSFKALDGTPKKLSDFRGKHVLIDFWGTWCGPCVGEIPYLKAAYAKYKSQGFEILGMDNELPDVTPEDFSKGLEKVKAFVVDKGVTWTQAQTESIKPLYERKFQIVAWPTIILLDPNGKILSVDRTKKGESGLRGDALDKTLAGLMPGALKDAK